MVGSVLCSLYNRAAVAEEAKAEHSFADFVVTICGSSEFTGSYKKQPRTTGHLPSTNYCSEYVKVDAQGHFYPSTHPRYIRCYYHRSTWQLVNAQGYAYECPSTDSKQPPQMGWKRKDQHLPTPCPRLYVVPKVPPLLHACLEQKTPDFVFSRLIKIAGASLLEQQNGKKQTAVQAVLISKPVSTKTKTAVLDLLSSIRDPSVQKKLLLSKCVDGHNVCPPSPPPPLFVSSVSLSLPSSLEK